MRLSPLPAHEDVSSRGALRIVLIYAGLAALWILFSDELVDTLVSDVKTLTRLQSYKGWLFVLITAILLHWLIRRYIRALGVSEGRMQQLLEYSPVAIAIVDHHDNIEYLNRKFVVDFGYSRDELPSSEEWWNRAITDADYRRHLAGLWRDAVSNAIERGVEFGPMEARITCKDGSIRIMELFAAPITGKILIIFLDITERKQAEEALLNQFEQVTTIFDSLNAIVYVADLETKQVLYLNKYGMTQTREDWQGKTCFEVVHPMQDPPCEFCTNERLVKDGLPQPDCMWEFRNTATGRWYQCIDRAIRWTDGRLVRLEIAIDMTERKEMEQMKDEILSAVSHEMRTPLTAMMGFTEFLLETEVAPDERKTYLTTVYNESRRLNELIGNFLDLQQLRARLVMFRFFAVEVCSLLEEVAGLFSFEQRNRRIAIECPEDLPPVRGDRAKLHQVLANLISNALKYSLSESPVILGARREGEQVTIWVSDEGVGIPPEVREKIFERLYRLDNTDRRQVGGAGLGLTIVRELVAAHGGTVRVESTVGKGSTFFVTLPVMTPEGNA